MHYGADSDTTGRIHGRAGTTILQLVSTPDDWTKAISSDYGPAGLPEQGRCHYISRSCRIVLRDYGPEEAASSRRRAVCNAGPFQGLRADREQRTQPDDSAGAAVPARDYGQGRIRRMAMMECTAASG